MSANVVALKQMLSKALDKKFQVYWEILKKFLIYRLTKKELDTALTTVLAQDKTKIALHNQFITAILRNARRSTGAVSISYNVLPRRTPAGALKFKEAGNVRGFSSADTKRRSKDYTFSCSTPALRALKRRMLEAARTEGIADVTDEAVDLMYRGIEHRLTEVMQRARAAPQRLAPSLPSVHVAVPNNSVSLEMLDSLGAVASVVNFDPTTASNSPSSSSSSSTPIDFINSNSNININNLSNVTTTTPPMLHSGMFMNDSDERYFLAASNWAPICSRSAKLTNVAATTINSSLPSTTNGASASAQRSATILSLHESIHGIHVAANTNITQQLPLQQQQQLQQRQSQQRLHNTINKHDRQFMRIRVRNNMSVRCAGVIASLDLIRALRLKVPKLAEDYGISCERVAMHV